MQLILGESKDNKEFFEKEDSDLRRLEIESILKLKEIGDFALFFTNNIDRWRGHFYAIKNNISIESKFSIKKIKNPDKKFDNKTQYCITKKK